MLASEATRYVLVAGAADGQWKHFKDVCKQAYLIVRRHADLFINLLNMMLATGVRTCHGLMPGIPELRSRDDVNYLRDTLFLQAKSEDEAADHFMQEVSHFIYTLPPLLYLSVRV